MTYSSLLHLSSEVLSEESVELIIDSANVEDTRKRKLEARPGAYLALTNLNADMCQRLSP